MSRAHARLVASNNIGWTLVRKHAHRCRAMNDILWSAYFDRSIVKHAKIYWDAKLKERSFASMIFSATRTK